MSLHTDPTPTEIDTILLADPGDLTLEILEHEVKREYGVDPDTGRPNVRTTSTLSRTGLFRVEKAKIIEQSDRYFRRMFSPNSRWRESTQDQVTLEEDSVTAMEVWLRVFHAQLPDMSLESVTIADLWKIIMAGEKYQFDRKMLSGWFRSWWTAKSEEILEDIKECRMMFFPAYCFNHAAAFQVLTETLAYEFGGHITECNPTSLHHMHLPSRVIQQLNAAKGRLRNIFHRELFSELQNIVASAKCSCKEATVFDYLRELQRIRVWPTEVNFRQNSICVMLERLRMFNDANMRCDRSVPATGVSNAEGTVDAARVRRPCSDCSRDWQAIVSKADTVTRNYFDGLCLDCMDKTKNLRLQGDEDDDYWSHSSHRDSYDSQCRIKHDQPTWYFSFMGRSEKRGQFEVTPE
ncbi:hypothetical protein FQN50_008506 [Emmonsiellopsis sp. PD_5]|nr:hypothetical protein FQN50_008506 [Emmonsiellopsis sp. PD_5]